jgi:voltage-gated potassium channel
MGIPRERTRLTELSRTAWQFWVVLALLLVLMTCATFFYFYIESDLSKTEWSFVDALYMTVLVITTIGFAEVHRLSQVGRIFTMGFAVTGLVLLALAAWSVASLVVGQLLSAEVQRRRRIRTLRQVRDHCIVCGYGRMGRETVHQLRRRGLEVVVIEQDPARIEALRGTDLPYVEGNATQDEQLRAAGIERAKCLIAAVGTDEDSLFIVLSARLLNPKLHIVARASQDETVDKLMRVGANSVHSPYVLGGRDLATAAVEPGVVHFLEQVLHQEEFDVDFRSVAVSDDSPVVGKPMLGSGVMQEGGAMILAVLNAEKRLHTNPRPDTTVRAGDTIIAMGTREQLARVQRAVGR